MNNSELISLFQNAIPSSISAVGSVVAALITAVFLRSNTRVDEFEKIKSGQFNDAIDDLLKSGKMTYTEYYKTRNFIEIAKKADEYYKDKKRINRDEEYDFDWFIRFYETAGNISDEQMQELWARILYGEIYNPGTYSVHLIDILKNMGKREAEIYRELCSYSIVIGSETFIPSYKTYLENCGIKYDNLLLMDELGLMNTNPLLIINFTIPPNRTALCDSETKLLTVSSTTGKDEVISIKQFKFTKVGCELRSVLHVDKLSDRCLEFLYNELSEIKNVSFELRKELD